LLKKLLASSEDHKITIFLRNASKLPSDLTNDGRVTIIEGALNDRSKLDSALQGVQIILSTLGPRTSLGLHLLALPWTEYTPISDCYTLLFELIQKSHKHTFIRAVILGTPSIPSEHDAWSVFWSTAVLGIWAFASGAYADVVRWGTVIHKIQEEGELDVTLARVPILTDGQGGKTAQTGFIGQQGCGWYLERDGLVDFWITEGLKGNWVGRDPVVFTG